MWYEESVGTRLCCGASGCALVMCALERGVRGRGREGGVRGLSCGVEGSLTGEHPASSERNDQRVELSGKALQFARG